MCLGWSSRVWIARINAVASAVWLAFVSFAGEEDQKSSWDCVFHLVHEQLGHESIKLTVDTYGSGLKSTHTSDRLDDPELDSVTTQG